MNVSKYAKLFISILIFFMNFSCVAGDGLLRVTGCLVDINGVPAESCILELHMASDERLLGTRKVEADFEDEFVISPWPHKYYLVTICLKDSTSFRTDIFKSNGTKYADKPLDLGKIVLKPMN